MNVRHLQSDIFPFVQECNRNKVNNENIFIFIESITMNSVISVTLICKEIPKWVGCICRHMHGRHMLHIQEYDFKSREL